MNKYVFGAIAIVFIIASYIYFYNTAQSNRVVVYVAHDQDYSQPILEEFESLTGIKVDAVYDTEASKTVGLTNRLIAEKNNPQADVFWNNEVTRTIQLKTERVLAPYTPSNFSQIDAIHKDPDGYWTGFAARARVLIVNTDLVSEADTPQNISALSAPQWAKTTTIADPRFGTTGSHLAALYTLWGKEKFAKYLTNLKQNGVYVAQSNGQTRDMVVSGEKRVGFTDTDDANDALGEDKPVRMVYPDQGEGQIGTLVIPNTVMLIEGAPNLENARTLIDYLVSAETESKLAHAKSAQMPLLPNVITPDNVPDISTITAMDISWNQVFENLAPTLELVEEILLQ
jgi:iron(III) transport system substrate-binding protein